MRRNTKESNENCLTRDMRNVEAVPEYRSNDPWNKKRVTATQEPESAEIKGESPACRVLESSGRASTKSPVELQPASPERTCSELEEMGSESW